MACCESSVPMFLWERLSASIIAAGKPLPVRLRAGASRGVQVPFQEMLAPDS
jgi:hypothetical protein